MRTCSRRSPVAEPWIRVRQKGGPGELPPEAQAEIREFQAYLVDNAARKKLGAKTFATFEAWKRYRDFKPVGPTAGECGELPI